MNSGRVIGSHVRGVFNGGNFVIESAMKFVVILEPIVLRNYSSISKIIMSLSL